MNITEFLAKHNLKSYSTPVNAWDAFSPTGLVFMQLWTAPNQWLKDHKNPQARLRVNCYDAAKHQTSAKRQTTGYAGRRKSIEAIKSGATAFAAMSSPPGNARGSGVWAKYADLERVYPVLEIETEKSGDVYVLLGPPQPASALNLYPRQN